MSPGFQIFRGHGEYRLFRHQLSNRDDGVDQVWSSVFKALAAGDLPLSSGRDKPIFSRPGQRPLTRQHVIVAGGDIHGGFSCPAAAVEHAGTIERHNASRQPEEQQCVQVNARLAFDLARKHNKS